MRSLIVGVLILSLSQFNYTVASAQFFETLQNTLESAIEGGAPCAAGAAVLAKLTNKEDETKVAALAAGATCAAAAVALEQERQAAIEQEAALDDKIAAQTIKNRQIAAENKSLQRELDDLSAQAQRVKSGTYRNNAEALKLSQTIASKADEASDRLEIVEARLSVLNTRYKQSTLSASEKKVVLARIELVEERARILREMEQLGKL